MSRSPAKSRNATATKSLKEKWLSIVQSTIEKREKAIGGSSTVTADRSESRLSEFGKKVLPISPHEREWSLLGDRVGGGVVCEFCHGKKG